MPDPGAAGDGPLLRRDRLQPVDRDGRQRGRHGPPGLDAQLPPLQPLLLKPDHLILGEHHDDVDIGSFVEMGMTLHHVIDISSGWH